MNALWAYLSNHNYWKKHEQLMKQEHLDANLAEKVDKIFIDASLYAKKRCKKRNKIWWSLPLAQAKFSLTTLKSYLSMIKCRVSGPRTTRRYGITVTHPESIKEAKKQIRAMQKVIKTIIQQSKEKRDKENHKLATIHALTGKTDKEKALKSIVNAEKMSTMWQKIRFTDRKRINSSLTSLQIPSSWPETTEDVSSVKEMDNPKTAKE